MQATNVTVHLRCLSLAAAGVLLLNTGVAQSTPSGAAETTGDDSNESDVVVLSPFTVSAEDQEGYRATATLAGSRIKTDLKDVAASITVLTKEFLTDISAADVNDVLAYTANAEGTRDFTATTSSLGRPQDDIAINPFGSNRLRGLDSADTTRDYFFTINDWIGFDTYNLDEVTISRGPNSVLAGLGSPAGIINYSPQAASTAANQGSVSFRYGSYDDIRATVNTNIVAVEDVLAFRFAGLWADRGFKQKPSFSEDKRLYLTGTWQPTKKTTIRAGYEYAEVDANNPNTLTPEDGISQWLAAGSPTYDSVNDAEIHPLLGFGGNRPVVVHNADGTQQGWWNDNTRAGFGQFNEDDVSLWSPLRLNSNKFVNVATTNFNPSLDEREFKAFNISVDQEIFDRFYANVSYVNETVDVERLNLFRTEFNVLRVDPNVRLPDGSPNPHLGELYYQARSLDNVGRDDNSNEVIRGTLTYDLDLREVNEWLGRYTLTGFLESRETETQRRQWNGKVTTDPEFEDFSYRYYLGGGVDSPPTTVPGQPGPVSNVQGIPPGFDSLPSGATEIDSFFGLKSDRRRLEKLDTAAIVLQAYLWEDKIVAMYGYRDDTDKAADVIGEDIGNNMVDPAGDFPELEKFSQSTDTYGVVVHPLEWLSLHYNFSENFVPNAGAVDLLANPTPAPTGEGEDYGFSIRAFENRLNLKVNWFELTAAGAGANSVTFPLNEWTIPFLELEIMPDIASTPAFQAENPGFVYQKAMADGLVTGDTRLNNAYTSDQVSEGIELELTYNISNNWRLMASVSRQEAKQSNIAPDLTAFIEERLDYWESTGLFDFLVSPGGGWGQDLTGREYWERDSLGAFIGYQSGDGRPSTQLAEWRASVITNYTFTDGPLKGFNIGGGARYIEGSVIGHPAITDEEGRVTGLDLDNPFESNEFVSVDAWVGYRTKVYDDKYDLSFQLNIRDLQESGGLRPISANSDGTHAAYRIVQPRTFYFTTTLGF